MFSFKFNLLLICLLFTALGCSHSKTQKPNALEFTKFLKNQSDQIKTVKGRVSIQVKTTEGKIRIPTDILIDRSTPSNPLVKMAAIGPFGVTYVVIVLKDAHLTWIDFEKKKIHTVEQNWHGIDLNSFADLILGVSSREPQKISIGSSAESADQFETIINDQIVSYDLNWYDGNDLHILMHRMEYWYMFSIS